jgi:uncharacterized membrane protein YcaP (DUF421 family)
MQPRHEGRLFRGGEGWDVLPLIMPGADRLLDTMLRTSLVYLIILAAMRLIGKRHVAQLSIVDFVLVLLVSNAVQNAMVGEDTSLIGGLVAAATLIVLNVILTRAIVRNERLGAFLEGEPALLIREGRVLDSQLAREGIRLSELEAAIREHGFESAAEVKQAILECDGSISVIPLGKTEEQRLPPLPENGPHRPRRRRRHH